jgi:hypothetical protein
MTFSFEFTMDDWMAFQQDYMDQSETYQGLKSFLIFILPFTLLSAGLWIYYSQDLNPFQVIMLSAVFGIITAIWILLAPKLIDKYNLKVVKNQLSEGKNTSILGQHDVILNKEFLEVKEPGSEGKVKWSSTAKITETDKYFFIYVTSASACVIPKFKLDPDQSDEIIAFLRKKMS